MSTFLGAVDLDQTLSEAFDRAADTWGHRTFLRMDGEDTTFAQSRDEVAALAAGLAERGVAPGTRLCVFMRNSKACVQTWLAANWLGAAWVPVNTEWRGTGLANAVRLVAPVLVIVDEALAGPLQDALGPDYDGLTVLVAPTATTPYGPASVLDSLMGAGREERHTGTDFADTAGMLYTSGTTGRSKACVLSHRYFLSQGAMAVREFGLTQDDVLYCPFPLFHADATALTVVPAIATGATAALGRRFSASGFWSEVRRTDATVFDFMGATLSILNKAEPRPDDLDNPVRLAWGVPVPEWAPQFEERFGLTVVELYGSVEANIPITQRYDQPRVVGSCGRPTPEFEIRIADEHGDEVPAGQRGELLIRPRIASTTLDGYFANPEATLEAFDGLWFHSGDMARRDTDDNIYFIGRLTESIRRRGENISAFEVEEGILTHPDVLECAAIGVPSDLTEEEIKVFVVARPGTALDAQTVWDHASRNLARFQVPRYVQLVDSLPKTPTGKVSKTTLSRGVGSDECADRERADATTTA
jgi:crotonobetaine/carnitine-CoA ligase